MFTPKAVYDAILLLKQNDSNAQQLSIDSAAHVKNGPIIVMSRAYPAIGPEMETGYTGEDPGDEISINTGRYTNDNIMLIE